MYNIGNINKFNKEIKRNKLKNKLFFTKKNAFYQLLEDIKLTMNDNMYIKNLIKEHPPLKDGYLLLRCPICKQFFFSKYIGVCCCNKCRIKFYKKNLKIKKRNCLYCGKEFVPNKKCFRQIYCCGGCSCKGGNEILTEISNDMIYQHYTFLDN